MDKIFHGVNTDRFKCKKIIDIILKSFYEVYNELGDGFLESVSMKEEIEAVIRVNLWLNGYLNL